MNPIIPNLFRTGERLDHRRVAENAYQTKSDIEDSLARRWTTCTVVFPLDSVSSSTAENLRRLALWVPSGFNLELEVVRIRVWAVGTANKKVTVTTSFDGPTIEVTMAGTTMADQKGDAAPCSSIVNSTTLKYITAEVESGGTISRGAIEVTLRADRGRQGASPDHSGYDPTVLAPRDNAKSSIADAIHSDFEAASDRHIDNDQDVRLGLYVLRSPTGTNQFRIPADGMRVAGISVLFVVAATADVDWNLKTTGGSSQARVQDGALGTGQSEDDAAAGPYQMGGTPTNVSSDLLLEFILASGTVDLTYCFVWYT